MALNLRTPGVYIVEESKFPPSVVPVETAIPAFVGYTARDAVQGRESLLNRPVAVNDLLEFQAIFGAPPSDRRFRRDPGRRRRRRRRGAPTRTRAPTPGSASPMRCATSTTTAAAAATSSASAATAPARVADDIADAHLAGLNALAREDEPTLLVFPDLSGMAPADPSNADQVAAVRASYHSVLVQALNQCATLGDRFLICDLWDGGAAGSAGITAFRNGIGTRNLKYGAAYHPFIQTTMPWNWDEGTITVSQVARRNDDGTIDAAEPSRRHESDGAQVGPANVESVDLRQRARASWAGSASFCRRRRPWPASTPPSTERAASGNRPANESLASVRSLTVQIDQDLNDSMNVDPSGKSINALRAFAGKGFLVWGARTLAGNDNEWRYVSVRRFFNMVEESCKKASEPFVFEPNDANTWVKVKAMIENFLVVQWRDGALAGAKPEDAFYVRVGLGTTMTAQDILEGRMIVEIGMAVVRPAEFIVLRFSHKMQEA